MNNLFHVCLYNTDEQSAKSLEDALDALNFVRLVASVSVPEDLAQVLNEQKIHMVLFHMDPDPDSVVEVIELASMRFPHVALLATSCRSDPQSILAPMRAGCDQFVCKPIDAEDLAQAVNRVASKRFAMQHKSRIICITGAAGGVGTTSIACNLAMEIAGVTERSCALVDLDLQFGNVAANFDCEPKYTFYDVATAGADCDGTILKSILSVLPCKVDLLARPDLMEQIETITPDTIYRVLELLMQSHENVVCDVPHTLGPCAITALTQADLILIASQLVVPGIRNAKRYYDMLMRTGIPEERIHFLVNRSGGRANGRVTLKDFEETVGKPVIESIPNDYQFVARSIDFGRPIAALDRNSPVRVAIHKLAVKINTDPRNEDGKNRRRGGFLKRLLSK